jgi:hypothetical protein
VFCMSNAIADHAYSTHCTVFFAIVSLVTCFGQFYMTTVLPYSGLFLHSIYQSTCQLSSLPLYIVAAGMATFASNSEAALHLFIKYLLNREDIYRLSLKDTKYLVVHAQHTLYKVISLSLSLSNGATAQGGPRPPLRVSSILSGLGWLFSNFCTLALLRLLPLHLPNATGVSLWGAFLLAH